MRSPAVASLLPFVLPLLLAAPALAQRPKTAEEAVARLQKLADKPESERFRAVGDVGDFVDDAATQALLKELQGAQGLAYRQAVLRALGEHRRPAAVPVLGQELADARSVRLFETVAQALAKQGDDGVQRLAKALADEKGNSPRANALCDALGRADGDGDRRSHRRRAGGACRVAVRRLGAHAGSSASTSCAASAGDVTSGLRASAATRSSRAPVTAACTVACS